MAGADPYGVGALSVHPRVAESLGVFEPAIPAACRRREGFLQLQSYVSRCANEDGVLGFRAWDWSRLVGGAESGVCLQSRLGPRAGATGDREVWGCGEEVGGNV